MVVRETFQNPRSMVSAIGIEKENGVFPKCSWEKKMKISFMTKKN
jgi:hypothetical protein